MPEVAVTASAAGSRGDSSGKRVRSATHPASIAPHGDHHRPPVVSHSRCTRRTTAAALPSVSAALDIESGESHRATSGNHQGPAA
jgi:hypothetical protein